MRLPVLEGVIRRRMLVKFERIHVCFLATSISLLLTPALGFGAEPARTLLGTWKAASANAKGATFEFEPADKVVWRLPVGTFSLAYKLDASASPWTLDLVGFKDGPLKDRTLYCIVERTGERFRMDCEPGAPTAEGAKKRPSAFVPEQTQEFVRETGTAQ